MAHMSLQKPAIRSTRGLAPATLRTSTVWPATTGARSHASCRAPRSFIRSFVDDEGDDDAGDDDGDGGDGDNDACFSGSLFCVYTYKYIYVHTHLCVYVCIYICICTHILRCYMYIHISIYTNLRVHPYIHVWCVYIDITCVYIYNMQIYIYIQIPSDACCLSYDTQEPTFERASRLEHPAMVCTEAPHASRFPSVILTPRTQPVSTLGMAGPYEGWTKGSVWG